jgi:hypothetical protein
MDCEKFESAMMDELYGDLDELTSAAAKRHVTGCARCAALFGGLRATRRVAVLPRVETPPGLEERILAAAREAQKVVPIRRRAAHVLSVAGSWAMRPQTAMAALFLVMIGSSVLLLRSRSAKAPAASSEVTVIEHGAQPPLPPPAAAVASPTTTSADLSAAAAPALGSYASAPSRAAEAKGSPPVMASAAPRAADDERRLAIKDKQQPLQPSFEPAAPVPGAAGGAAGAVAQSNTVAGPPQGGEALSFDTALQSYRAGRYDDAARAFDSLAAGDPNADLWAARAVREGKGCRNALARFDRVARRAAGTASGWDALLEGALCYRNIGDFDNARVRLKELLKVDSHRDRAQAELDRINQVAQQSGDISPASGAARPAPRKAAAPAAPAAAPPATALDSMRK